MTSASTSETSTSSPPAPRVLGYRPELDVVRFLAFLLIFFHHFLLYSPRYLAKDPDLSSNIFRMRVVLAKAAEMGLPLFFTLSAYLITEILLCERSTIATISVRNFYIRRFLRIWPLYFAGITVGVALALEMQQYSQLVVFATYVFFCGNIFSNIFGWPVSPMVILWSISVEEQFYLIWPWAVRWCSKKGLFYCALLLIVLANATLWHFGHLHTDTGFRAWTNTFVQLQMFAVGILLALRKRIDAGLRPLTGLACVVAGLILWLFAGMELKFQELAGAVLNSTNLMLGYALIGLGCAGVLQGFCLIGSAYMPKWAIYFGKISYGLYVFHLLGIEFGHIIFQSAKSSVVFWLGSFFTAAILTVLAAVFSYYFLELPFLRLKRRFEVLHTRPI